MDYDFPETVGNGMSSQLTIRPSFFRGVDGQPPIDRPLGVDEGEVNGPILIHELC
jgi:hypothetical protein